MKRRCFQPREREIGLAISLLALNQLLTSLSKQTNSQRFRNSATGRAKSIAAAQVSPAGFRATGLWVSVWAPTFRRPIVLFAREEWQRSESERRPSERRIEARQAARLAAAAESNTRRGLGRERARAQTLFVGVEFRRRRTRVAVDFTPSIHPFVHSFIHTELLCLARSFVHCANARPAR